MTKPTWWKQTFSSRHPELAEAKQDLTIYTAPDKPKNKLGDKSYPAAWRRPLKGGGNKKWGR